MRGTLKEVKLRCDIDISESNSLPPSLLGSHGTMDLGKNGSNNARLAPSPCTTPSLTSSSTTG